MQKGVFMCPRFLCLWPFCYPQCVKSFNCLVWMVPRGYGDKDTVILKLIMYQVKEFKSLLYSPGHLLT